MGMQGKGSAKLTVSSTTGLIEALIHGIPTAVRQISFLNLWYRRDERQHGGEDDEAELHDS
jgi:hypothetical protein